MESFLFSSNFENKTDVIFLTCNGLSNAKEGLVKSKIEELNGKKLTFPSNEKKFQQLILELKL